MSAKIQIKISQGKDAGKIFAFTEHDTFVFGRMADCHACIFHSSEDARRRVWTLIEKEKQPGLLPEEKLDLEDYLKLEHLLVLAKARLSSGHAG